MNNNLYAFLFALIAGISTLIGYLIIYIDKDTNEIISKSLGFSIGVMVSISIIDLLPSSYNLIKNYYIIIPALIIVIIGFIVGIMFSGLINHKIDKKPLNKPKLYKIGIISMITLILHNIPEGIATFITTNNNYKLGLIMTIAILLHNIPEGISISIPIYYSTKNKFKAFIYTLVSGLSEPIGALIAYFFLSKYINNIILGILYSFIAGMMINISINELYKESITYNKKYTIIYIVFGVIFMAITHFLLNYI